MNGILLSGGPSRVPQNDCIAKWIANNINIYVSCNVTGRGELGEVKKANLQTGEEE